MALADILDRILDDAREEASSIAALGRVEAERVRRETAAESDELERDLVSSGEKKLRHNAEITLSRLRLEMKNGVLAVKRELLRALFSRLPEALRLRSPEEYVDFFVDLVPVDPSLRRLEVEVGDGDVKRYGREYVDLVEEKFRSRFPVEEGKLSVKGGSFEGGIVITADDVVYNLSLTFLLEKARKSIEAETAALLFAP